MTIKPAFTTPHEEVCDIHVDDGEYSKTSSYFRRALENAEEGNPKEENLETEETNSFWQEQRLGASGCRKHPDWNRCR